MNLNDINKYIQETMESAVDCVLEGTVEIIVIPYARPGAVMSYLRQAYDIKSYDQFDTNGYQWDYLLTFKFNGQNYVLSGDGYYSNNCKLMKED